MKLLRSLVRGSGTVHKRWPKIPEGTEERRELWRFDSPESLGRFRLLTDRNMGGTSEATFTFDEKEKCAVLQGMLDLTPPPGADNSGYAAIEMSMGTHPVNLEEYDALSVECKTDGRLYVASIRPQSVLEDDLWQIVMASDADKWTKILLPFGKFVATNRGFVEGPQQLDARQVFSVALMMAERKNGPFRISIRSVAAVCMDLAASHAGARWLGVSRDKRGEW